MKDVVKKWVDQSSWREGFLALGVRHPDRATACKARANGFNSEALDNALHSTADLFQSLDKNTLNFGRVCLVYKSALLHAERRPDGICLAVFTARNVKAYDSAGLEKLFGEFQKLA